MGSEKLCSNDLHWFVCQTFTVHHWIAVQKLIGLDCIAAPMSLSCYFELALHTEFAMNVHSKKALQHHQKKAITGDDIKAPQKRDMNRKSFVYIFCI